MNKEDFLKGLSEIWDRTLQCYENEETANVKEVFFIQLVKTRDFANNIAQDLDLSKKVLYYALEHWKQTDLIRATIVHQIIALFDLSREELEDEEEPNFKNRKKKFF